MRVMLNALQAGNQSGTGRYIIELVKHLPRYAGDIELTVLWPQHVPQPSADVIFIRVDTRQPLRRLWHDQFVIRHYSADIIHYPATVGALVATPNTVLTIHDLGFMRDPAWHRRSRTAYYTFAVRRSAKQARRIIADSAATAADVQEMLRISEDRIDIVPLGVGEAFCPASQEAQAAVRRHYSLPDNFFLHVGTLEPRKNLVRLIEAYSRVAERCPHDLVLAGREGWKTARIHAAAAASPYTDRIHFPGYIADADLPAVLSAAEAFVWPSLWEGFGLPPLDAMACGTPVISSSTSSMPEVLGDAALFVDPEDTRALADTLLKVATDEALRGEMRIRGQARTAQFSWDRTAQATIETYRKALAK